jgi:hypothetical protein
MNCGGTSISRTLQACDEEALESLENLDTLDILDITELRFAQYSK